MSQTQIKDIIRRKREGLEHGPEEIEAIVRGYLDGSVKDYQVAAWLMAVFLRGMSPKETATLTRLMWHSGTTFPRPHRDDFWIDKHSTGGVGDKTSLLLVPLVSVVCERHLGGSRVRIPMVSGRGLGHTGGTLDKLESVPGFSPSISIERGMELLHRHGYFMMGQTLELAPADRLIYALRDVTATVECLPLIVASILSKKLSENLDGLVLDVKYGSGAFMKPLADAQRLARALVDAAKAQGVKTVALLTRMDEPLGYMIGNHLEVEECADFLQGKRQEVGLREVTLALAGAMIELACAGKLTRAQAISLCERELGSAAVMARFREMFEIQGGDYGAFEHNRHQLRAKLQTTIFPAPHAGFISRFECERFGILLNSLGGGRNRKEDNVDPLVGIELLHKVGQHVAAGEPLVKVYHRRNGERDAIHRALSEMVHLSAQAPRAVAWIEGEMT